MPGDHVVSGRRFADIGKVLKMPHDTSTLRPLTISGLPASRSLRLVGVCSC
jgi:hypothetical protein